MASKIEKVENLEMSTVGRGICQENWKSWKMRNIQLSTWKMTKSLNNMKNEKCALKVLEYGKKIENHGKWETSTWRFEKWRNHWKPWKMRNAHCWTWNMARKLKKTAKWEIHNLWREIWWGKIKKVENLEMPILGRGIWQENWKSWKMRNNHLTTRKMRKSLKIVKNYKCTL